MFQLNLDGQQITQKIAGSGFGQPRFSREAIAEFQIVTNLFDITQGRSAGMQVQAISKSGTNTQQRQRLRLLPRRQAQRAPTRSPSACCRIRISRSAARSAGRSCGTSSTTSRRTNTSASRARSSAARRRCRGRRFTRAVQERRRRAFSRASTISSRRNSRLSVRGSRVGLGATRSCSASTAIRRTPRCRPRPPPTSSASWSTCSAGSNKVHRSQGRLQQLRLDQRAAAEMVGIAAVPTSPASPSARPTTSRSIPGRTTGRAATT